MAITTYALLKTAVIDWMDIPATDVASQIDSLVSIAEARIFREARTKDNEANLNSAITAGVIAVPADYVEMRFAYVSTNPVQVLERKTAQWIYQNFPVRANGGIPKYFARDNTNFIFGPYPGSYTVLGVYYKRLAALSTGVHALFTNNPDLYLFACLAESEILIGRDKRVGLWEAKYQKILMDVNQESDDEGVSGSTLMVRAG